LGDVYIPAACITPVAEVPSEAPTDVPDIVELSTSRETKRFPVTGAAALIEARGARIKTVDAITVQALVPFTRPV
jgi:hypothetical protein